MTVAARDSPRKLLFIVNPKAGKKMSDVIVDTIRRVCPPDVQYRIAAWRNDADFDEITSALASEGYTDAIAVGGDGTVNKVASVVCGTGVRLGIVPTGSGNGLARSLGMSMHVEDAIAQIAAGRSAAIDCGVVNGLPFFVASGAGFDAHIVDLFNRSRTRGLKTYVRITAARLFRYQPRDYTVELNGTTVRRKAFLITVANASQYGNDFHIAPEATLDDGLFHVVIVKAFSLFRVFAILTDVLRKRAHRSPGIETYVTDRLTIHRETDESIHVDGDPRPAGRTLDYVMRTRALQVLVGPGYRAGA